MESGAPRPVWNLRSHGPSIVVTVVSLSCGSRCDDSDVRLPKTTNTVPHGSSLSGTVVRSPEMEYETSSLFPVSAYQSIGTRPATRNVAFVWIGLSLRLSIK